MRCFNPGFILCIIGPSPVVPIAYNKIYEFPANPEGSQYFFIAKVDLSTSVIDLGWYSSSNWWQFLYRLSLLQGENDFKESLTIRRWGGGEKIRYLGGRVGGGGGPGNQRSFSPLHTSIRAYLHVSAYMLPCLYASLLAGNHALTWIVTNIIILRKLNDSLFVSKYRK